MVRPYRSVNRRQIAVGHTYGRMTVVSSAGRNRHGNLLWLCRCSCGVEKVSLGCNLLSGSPSCGCHKKEILTDRNTKHGLSGLAEYSIWLGMRQRCQNPDNRDYGSYGGRGIRVCQRWSRFENFISDMGRRPSPTHTLEREDNDGHYSPDNCVWADRKTQSRNKRNVPLYEFDGSKKSLAEWSELSGVHVNTLRKRLSKGWILQRAMSQPVRPIKGVHY